MLFIEAIIALGIILFCAEIFTNGVEVFGEKLSLSQAVVGSVLAAVGTALPETIIPLVAIFLYKDGAGSHIGIGAILGAPFMLITAGFFLIGLAVFIGFLQKRRPFKLYIEEKTLKRDFFFYLLSYSLAIFLPLIFPNTEFLHYFIAIFILINYAIYLYLTFGAESLRVESYKDLYFEKPLKWLGINYGKSLTVFLALIQSVVAIVIMVKGAHLFVHALELISLKLGFSPLLFALIVAPLATELPEKFNSFLWTLRGKDVLALGNMTGAMVFQSTFPVSVGLLFTEWKIEGFALFSALIALGLGSLYLFIIKIFKNINPAFLIFSGICYIFYIISVLSTFN